MKFTGSTHAGSEQRTGGDYSKEEQRIICSICGQPAKVITGNRYGIHADATGGFFCENGGKPIGENVVSRPCFMCVRENIDPPAEGEPATGIRLDYSDTYYSGPNEGQFRRIVFRGYVCDMHASGDDIVTIKYL